MHSGLLRLFDEFDTEDDPQVMPFQYHHDDADLAVLRERYTLDSIAGAGDDWSKITNLLHWLCENTRHNGATSQNIPVNALAILEFAFQKGMDGAVNCRKLATVLAEVYLAIGLKSRIVSIHPINPFDSDNHVVTLVWCDSFGKWVMVDPSFRAYLTDAAGNVLNPWEARALFSRQAEVRCSPGIWYNAEAYKPEHYLAYVAKDLFFMHSPLENRCGSENNAGQQWIWLAPRGFDPLKRETYNDMWRRCRQGGTWDDNAVARVKAARAAKPVHRHIFTTSLSSFAKAPVCKGE